jgi:hypothetical protein
VTRAGTFARAAGLALAVALAAGACRWDDDDARTGGTRIPEPEDVIDEALMLSLAQAKNFHLKADVHLQDGNVDAAIAEVARVLTVPFPPDAPERQDVLLDARARLAKLLLGKGDAAAALRAVDDGIAAATRESFFLANALTVRAEVLTYQATRVSDEATARELRRHAIEALDRANAINLRLQRELMQEKGR